jgi:hypothetical protein
MLLNEFLKEHQKVQEQGATITLEKQVEAPSASIQKMSAQLELSQRPSQIVGNR